MTCVPQMPNVPVQARRRDSDDVAWNRGLGCISPAFCIFSCLIESPPSVASPDCENQEACDISEPCDRAQEETKTGPTGITERKAQRTNNGRNKQDEKTLRETRLGR